MLPLTTRVLSSPSTLRLRSCRASALAAARSKMATSASSTTPMEDAIREKLTSALSPTLLQVHNDSHLHAHHAAMAGSSSRETHFRITVASAEFASKPQPARHRIIYGLLKDELSREGGIHALQLQTRTPEELERLKATSS